METKDEMKQMKLTTLRKTLLLKTPEITCSNCTNNNRNAHSGSCVCSVGIHRRNKKVFAYVKEHFLMNLSDIDLFVQNMIFYRKLLYFSMECFSVCIFKKM